MENKTYLVLTPEKIEDIFRDLQSKLCYDNDPSMVSRSYTVYAVKILNEKKQELLNSIK